MATMDDLGTFTSRPARVSTRIWVSVSWMMVPSTRVPSEKEMDTSESAGASPPSWAKPACTERTQTSNRVRLNSRVFFKGNTGRAILLFIVPLSLVVAGNGWRAPATGAEALSSGTAGSGVA